MFNSFIFGACVALFIIVLVFVFAVVVLNGKIGELQIQLDRLTEVYENYVDYNDKRAEKHYGFIAEQINITNSHDKEIDICKQAYQDLSNNFEEHLKGAQPKADVKVLSQKADETTEKIDGKWCDERKHQCQEFILHNKENLTYAEMSVILSVPTSTLKRWGAELKA